ncbi:hypothetical protein ACS0TY_030156 [Phlomoides rotata]
MLQGPISSNPENECQPMDTMEEVTYAAISDSMVAESNSEDQSTSSESGSKVEETVPQQEEGGETTSKTVKKKKKGKKKKFKLRKCWEEMRGIGSNEKRREVRELVLSLKTEVCCIQESKVEAVDSRTCKAIWGDRPCEWAYLGAEGNSGGIITIWNPTASQKVSEWSRRGMLVVNGIWLEDGGKCTIINVEEGERVGRAATWDENDMDHFNNFIRGSDLLEMPLIGRSYTWYRPNGACKSKLDRLLVNASWVSKWPDVRLKGGRRTLSDHVPIFIEGSNKDWGPKPFKFFNQWINHKEYKGVVEGVWATSGHSGWAGFEIKEKLKTLKTELNKWSREVFGELEKNIEDKKVEIERLDMIDDTMGLDEEEEDQRQQLVHELMKESAWREKQLYQKSRVKWIKEGDINSKFYHNWVNKKNKRNELSGLWKDNRWVDSVHGVKQEVSSLIWESILRWLGVSMVLHIDPKIHFLHFGECLGSGTKATVARTIWIGTVWSLWNTRNDIVFNKATFNADREYSKIKISVWNWISTLDQRLLDLNLRNWLGDPTKCLEIM